VRRWTTILGASSRRPGPWTSEEVHRAAADARTGSTLGARDYDPAIGRFLRRTPSSPILELGS
jgi:hypothetical protein